MPLHSDEMMEANRGFHDAISSASGNSMLIEFYNNMLDHVSRLSRLSFGARLHLSHNENNQYKIENIINEHREITDSIEKSDSAYAYQLGLQHAELFRLRIINYISKNDAVDIKYHELISIKYE